MRRISTIITTLLMVLWFVYGVMIIARGSVSFSDWVITWIGLMLMCFGNLIIDIERDREDK